MKFWSIFILTFFINFTVMPSVIAVFDLDIHQNNIVLAEEEVHTNSIEITEKVLSKPLNINDFIKVVDEQNQRKDFVYMQKRFISPHISIISPPPEC